MATGRKLNYSVLVIDDSDDDGKLLEFAMQQLDRFRLIGRLTDGEEAMAYLKGDGRFADRQAYPFPDLLLLDLRMPRVDGFQILQWLHHQSFPRLQIVVLSGSDYCVDMDRALALGAHYFCTKPMELHKQVAMLQALEQKIQLRTSRKQL
jgi:CheY-like chemotaxis protein